MHVRQQNKLNFDQQFLIQWTINKSKWNVIREIGIGGKSAKTDFDIDVNKLNNQFVYSDVLDPLFLIVLTLRFLPYYTPLFNTVLTKSTFPDESILTKIFPIPKINSGFRSIAIFPFLLVMGNIVAKQINNHLESTKHLTFSQTGFMKGRSCTTALLNVIENLKLELKKNSVSFFFLLDHSKAFDTVTHKILLNKLWKPSNSDVSVIFSYLLNRCYLNGIFQISLISVEVFPRDQ